MKLFWTDYFTSTVKMAARGCDSLIPLTGVYHVAKCVYRPVARGGQGGSADPPLRTKGPLFGTSRVKLLRPITING